MGDFSSTDLQNQAARLKRSLIKNRPDLNGKIEIKPIRYSDILQQRQSDVWERMRSAGDDFGRGFGSLRNLSRYIWLNLRRFLIFNITSGFLVNHQAAVSGSVYKKVMHRFKDEIIDGWEKIPAEDRESTVVVVLADALGGHLISNYIWDVQCVLADDCTTESNLLDGLDPSLIKIVSLQKIDLLVTTGCSIPLFISGFPEIQAIENNRLGYRFRWLNIYDDDDLMGWPLQPLGAYFDEGRRGRSYADLVEDVQMNAHGGLRGYFMKGLNPYTHWEYLETGSIKQRLAQEIGRLLN